MNCVPTAPGGRDSSTIAVIKHIAHQSNIKLEITNVILAWATRWRHMQAYAGQVVEPQRRHDRHHRRTGRLVATDLDLTTGAPVGVIDDARREPQDPLLDLSERLE